MAEKLVVELAEVKKYLRVDHNDDDTLIRKFIRMGTKEVIDTLRVSDDEFQPNAVIRTAILYAVAYLYEHRENADMDELTKNLRYILSTERTPAF